MEGNPSGGTVLVHNLMIIAGCISVGTKVKHKEMDSHSNDK